MGIYKVKIEDELVSSYLSYSLSVIIGRAIPDIRDGLKPVQRRIIWTMWEENIKSNSQHRKSAKIVGSCIGKYHPHGDKPVYDALVRMAQDFVMRYPLIDGQGNFGSIDGDEPAAMRYTEARLTKISEELLKDIEEGTVDFSPNYDETLEEPKYLPTRFPNLLVNGSSGIAVGMSTSIPPHNITEIMDALIYMLDKPKCSVDEIMKIIKGPDFPTGGIVVGDIRQIYEEGKGQITIYSRYKIEKGDKGRKVIVFYEVPYQENKSKIVEKIAELSNEKVIDGIVRVADESDRRGIRVVVEVKEGFEIEPIIGQLYDKTGLKSNFFINMLVVDGIQPISVNLRTLLERFIEFRKDIVLKRTKFRLEKAEKHLHILEGYMKALSAIDEVIALIRKSENQSEAKEKLIKRFDLTDIQAQAILDLKLGRLSKLDAEEIKKEYEKTLKEVKELKEILKSEEKLKGIIKQEFEEIKKQYGDQRRTEITDKPPVKEEVAQEYKIIVTYDLYINTFAKTERTPRLPVRSSFISSGDLACVSNLGKVYRVRLEKIKSWTEKGMPVKSLVRTSKDEEIIYVCPAYEEKYLVFLTKMGFTKKFRLSEVYDLTARGEVIFELEEGDEIKDAVECSEEDQIFFVTKGGMILGVQASDITARVSKGIELSRGDVKDEVLLAVAKTKEDNFLVCATEKYVKMIKSSELKVQTKGGVGITLVPEKALPVVDAIFINSEEDTVAITYETDGKINYKYFPAKKIPVLTRQAMGKELVEGKIISLGKVI
ncbi:MAG: DNA topoisomerase 4 subunit A [Candidatus Calescibacterium sp.]|nr:DNA topoisomerase 4 subunit A [Candidatus Calescibacterium sp.]MCX7733717.1 DNA topoisomerase 4 subunit A [bacterium]MDW8087499.1 DNA topoisomerase (ATP-hydrolyzing) [Candidatus Calescibacterium sp.]